MTAGLARGWAMARACAAVLKQHPKLALLPAASAAILLLVATLVLVSLLPQFGAWHAAAGAIWQRVPIVWLYVLANGALFVLTVLVTTLNAALIHCALRCHAGQAPSLRAGLAAAARALPQISGWAVVLSTIGAALYALEIALRANLGVVGAVIGRLFDVGWSVTTFFVLPVLVVERVGPVTAIRRSAAMVKQKWGESLAGETRFGLVGMLFIAQALLLFFAGLALLLSSGAHAMAGLGPVLMALGAVYGIVAIVLLQALSAIFQAGLYVYASTGALPPALDPNHIAGAFRRKG